MGNQWPNPALFLKEKQASLLRFDHWFENKQKRVLDGE
jgi:hypothetical protein